MRLIHVLLALLVNAVPVYGVYALGWSATSHIAYFSAEFGLHISIPIYSGGLGILAGALVMLVRIALHRRLTRKRGHWMAEMVVNGVRKQGTYLGQFAMISIIFTLAHGVFVGIFSFALGQNHPDNPAWQFNAEAFRIGAIVMSGILLLDLLIDLPALKQRSFAWLEGVAGRRLLRVLVLHLGLIFGMWAAASSDRPAAMILVLLGLKALFDVLLAGRAVEAHAAAGAAWTGLVGHPAMP